MISVCWPSSSCAGSIPSFLHICINFNSCAGWGGFGWIGLTKGSLGSESVLIFESLPDNSFRGKRSLIGVISGTCCDIERLSFSERLPLHHIMSRSSCATAWRIYLSALRLKMRRNVDLWYGVRQVVQFMDWTNLLHELDVYSMNWTDYQLDYGIRLVSWYSWYSWCRTFVRWPQHETRDASSLSDRQFEAEELIFNAIGEEFKAHNLINVARMAARNTVPADEVFARDAMVSLFIPMPYRLTGELRCVFLQSGTAHPCNIPVKNSVGFIKWSVFS